MTVREQARYWLVGFAVFSAALWLLAGVLAPFVLGAAIAYLMDPAADWLERHGFSRLQYGPFLFLPSVSHLGAKVEAWKCAGQP